MDFRWECITTYDAGFAGNSCALSLRFARPQYVVFCVTNNQGDCRVNTDDPRKDAASEARRLRRLLEASRLLNSTLELRELTEIVLRIIQDELPIERCTLFVVDRRQKLLRSLVAQGIEQFEIVLAFGEGLAGTVARTGEPLDVVDPYA